MAQKKPGLMLYFEDYDSLRTTLCAEDLVTVLDAMVALSRTGTFSDEEKLSDAAKICWRFMKPRVERDSQQYAERVKKRRDAANARWNAQASMIASASTCTDEMHMQNFMPIQLSAAQLNAEAAHMGVYMGADRVGDLVTERVSRNIAKNARGIRYSNV